MTILKRILNKLRPVYGWFGDYSDWNEARKQSKGYESANILAKVETALLKVKNGEAVAERDSVLLNEIEYSWPLLANILYVANLNEGRINILDFGGSLGSTYFQNRTYLKGLKSVSWNIVEQPNFVAAGKKNFENDELAFFENVEQCIINKGMPNILLLSCVLPYLSDPNDSLVNLKSVGIEFIIVENTPLHELKNRNILTVQKVHPDIYPASYPCWLLSKKLLIEQLKPDYALVNSYRNDSVIHWNGKKIQYQGLVFKKID